MKKKKKVNFKQIPDSLSFGAVIPDKYDIQDIKPNLKLNRKYGKGKSAIKFFITEIKYEAEKFKNESNKKEIESNKKEIERLNNIVKKVRTFVNSLEDINGVKIAFDFCVKLVKQNYEIYPILFNFIGYIKENILRDKLGYPEKKKILLKEVFNYISKLTSGFKNPSAIKKYYYDKFLDLIKK